MRYTILAAVVAALMVGGCARITSDGLEVRPLASAADLAETQARLIEEQENRVEADTNLGNHLASEVTQVREDLSSAIQTAVAENDPARALSDLSAKLDETNSRLAQTASEARTLSDEQLAQLEEWAARQREQSGGDSTLLHILLGALGLGTVGAGTVAVKANGRAKKAEADAKPSTP